MDKEFLTTGEVAALCSVTPDAVLKWIKTGRISAIRTPGGHFRIHRNDLPTDLIQSRIRKRKEKPVHPFQYCWDFYAQRDGMSEMCRDCLVYKTRAKRCYELIHLPDDSGHTKLHCATTCEDCDYYKTVQDQRLNVLVVTDRRVLRDSIDSNAQAANYNLTFCDSEYQCAVVIDSYRPDFIVIDPAMGKQQCENLVRHLSNDERLPLVRLILAGEEEDVPKDCEKKMVARMNPTFTALELEELLENLIE